jgi:hypothetical protein
VGGVFEGGVLKRDSGRRERAEELALVEDRQPARAEGRVPAVPQEGPRPARCTCTTGRCGWRTPATWCCLALDVCGPLRISALSPVMSSGGQARVLAFGEFRRQLTYKCQWYGSQLWIADRWFPSSKTCSACGHVNATLTLPDRTWDCPECGAGHDRDENAGTNLARLPASQAETQSGSKTASVRLATVKRVNHPGRAAAKCRDGLEPVHASTLEAGRSRAPSGSVARWEGDGEPGE